MACLLDKEDVLAIYGDIYETLLGRINGDVKTKFNPAEYIKNLHACQYRHKNQQVTNSN